MLGDAGYDDATIARVQAIVRKDGLARAAENDDVQVLEDALCLVFLETQLVDIAARLDPEKLPGVITKTAQKMSAAGLAAIADVPLGPGARRLLDEAFARDVVQRYLTGLGCRRLGRGRGVARSRRRAHRPVPRQRSAVATEYAEFLQDHDHARSRATSSWSSS